MISKKFRDSQSRLGGSAFTQYALYREGKCAQCGKDFLHTADHVYKRKEGNLLYYYCSYTCYRVKEREDEQKEREKFERALTSDIRREEQLEERDRARRKRPEPRFTGLRHGKNHEYVVFEDRKLAAKYADHVQRKIDDYRRKALGFSVGTKEYAKAMSNLAHWKRVLKNMKVIGG